MFKLTWRKKLFFFSVIVALIPIAISGINMISSTKDELKSSTNNELISTAGQLAQEINNFYTNKWIAPLLIIKSGLESEDLGAEEKAAILSAGIKNIEDIVALAVLFEVETGEFVPAIETQKESFTALLEQHSLKVAEILSASRQEIRALKIDKKTIGSHKYIEPIDTWLMTIILPVSIAGAPSAILSAQINLNSLRERVENQPLSKNGRIFLIDNTGRGVFDIERKDLSYLKVVQDAKDLLRTGSRAQGVTSYIRPTGERVVGCYAFPLNLEWAIIAEINEEQAYLAVSRMINSLSLWVVLGLAIAILGVLIFSRQISKPILKMSKAAEEISSGHFDVQLGYKANDEIGILGKSLENMARSLKESFEKIENQKNELEEYSKNLEVKVDQRTNELKEKNLALEQTLQKLKETQDQLIVHEKLASLGALTAGVAHEIKNPLNFVNNFAFLSVGLVEELQEELEKDKEKIDIKSVENIDDILRNLKMNVNKISEHGKRADRIVHGMLQHARSDEGGFQMTPLNSYVEECVNLAHEGLHAKDPAFKLTIERNYDQSIGEININSSALSQVLVNIINNAIYAFDAKKKKVGNDYLPTLLVSTKDLGKKIEMRIRDNGIGIPEKVVDKIFEPFFTTKPTGEGTGLGLSLSYDIIARMHKGEIKVETEENQFTEFIIILPKS